MRLAAERPFAPPLEVLVQWLRAYAIPKNVSAPANNSINPTLRSARSTYHRYTPLTVRKKVR